MKRIDTNVFLIEGDLYLNIPFDDRILARCKACNTIHAKGDVLLNVMKKPNVMKKGDEFINYELFTKLYGPIYDIIAFSDLK